MIKFEHTVLASPEQMEFIIEGMRNPMNSWDKSDSEYKNIKLDKLSSSIADLALAGSKPDELEKVITHSMSIIDDLKRFEDHDYIIGSDDFSLMLRLSKAGTDHRKYMRMMPVYVRVTAPLYWWKEFDTYKVGTVANSCSTMHKIQAKEFTLEDFSCEHLKNAFDVSIPYTSNITSIFEYKKILEETMEILNNARDLYLETKDKIFWWQLIQLLPSSYNQTRNVMMNYEVLANIYKSRKDHKLDEWREFCKWIESLPYSELITGKEKDNG
jgi:hypothetical protein